MQKCLDTYHIPSHTWYEGWRKDGKFMPAIEEARRIQTEATWAVIRSGAARAANVLIEIMDDPMGKSSVRVQAAQTVLDRGGFSKAEPISTDIQPYSTREELLAALRDIPADVLKEALESREQVAHYVGVVAEVKP